MLMRDNFEDKVTQLFIGIIVTLIVCFAWWTTNINEQPQYHTVLLLERRHRRRTSRSRLTTHIQSTSIEGTQTEEVTNPTVGDNNSEEERATQNSESSKPPEASTSTTVDSSSQSVRNNQTSLRNIEEDELRTIVHIMDADANVVRMRRLAYYENQQGVDTNHDQATTSTNSQEIEHTEVYSSVMEHNYADRETVFEESPGNIKNDGTSNENNSNIRIKLKYLNDELKLVDGRLEEQLGDFKRRHFQLEFSSNKLVRLIFNGQVLQPDTETLQSCGLFDNCVVHCLIHQQRNNLNDVNNGESSFVSGSSSRIGNATLTSQGINNNNQGRDWDLGNVLLAFVSIVLGSAWYFRYEYAHLYTITATVGLVAITGIFTIFLVGIYFPEPQLMQQRERHLVST